MADRILARFGSVAAAHAERPPNSQSNEVWMTPDVVLRLAAEPGPGWLAREAALAPLLPAQVGYPRVLGSGVEDAHEWIVAERLPGHQLMQAWTDMDSGTRLRALASLWTHLLSLRDVDVEAARTIGCTSTPFYELDQQRALAQLDELADTAVIDEDLGTRVTERLARGFTSMRDVPWRLGHTDAGAHNALWDGTNAIPIDLEFACIVPIDLEIDCLFRHFPDDSPDEMDALRTIVGEDLARPGADDRLLGYALLRDIWTVHIWLRHRKNERPADPWPPQDLAEWDPIIRLRTHAVGRGEWMRT